jgi:hypothetical protein
VKVLAAVSVLVALASSAVQGQVFRSLPPQFTNSQSFGQSIDANGVVVGYTGLTGPPTVWRPSGTTYVREALPLPLGQQYGAGNSIGASGVIAGYTQPTDHSTATATIWTAPPGGAYAATPLPAPDGSTLTSAYSVNANGSVGGFRETASGGTSAVVWDPIGPAYAATLLPGLSGWVDTAATAINDNGDLAGYCFAALGGPRGAVWQKTPSGYVAKDVIAGAEDVVISAINNYGTGAGVVNGDQAAVMVLFEDEYYAGELAVPFGSSDSAANAVNNADALAGYLKDPTTAQSGAEAALWLPGDDEWELVNLDDWFNQIGGSLAPQWVLEEAFDISDNWLVTGTGTFDSTPTNGVPGVTRGFVLDVSSLVPEPSAGAIALIGAAMLLRRGRR